MLKKINYWLTPAEAPGLLTVLGGLLIGITLTYFLTYAREIYSGLHVLDFEFLGTLLLLGIPVIGVGWYHNQMLEQA